MSNTARIYQIDQILYGRKFISRQELQERLGVSLATLKRDLAFMKDQLNAPIIFDRDLGGYRFQNDARQIGPQYELPGLWFSAEEIHALLTMQHLLSSLDRGGLLGPHIQPLLARLTGILGTEAGSSDEVQRRIRIITVGARGFHLDHFQAVASSLLRRKRLLIRYQARGTGEVTEREVSPQRLMHYRDNWYLDGWCHLRDGLRAFSVDAIESVEILDRAAKPVADGRLDAILGTGDGIFSGEEVQLANPSFPAERAKMVKDEHWHPSQKGEVLRDGSFQLQVPFSDDRELLMDILKYGADCVVIEPETLRKRAIDAIQATLKRY